MQDTNKALTALVRSMKRNLKTQHGVEVPHAALRACLLQAQGENPHAFAARQAQGPDTSLRTLVDEAPQYFHPGYDFDGKKLEWLQRAGLVSADAPRDGDDAFTRTMFIVYDDQNMASALAFDPEGRVLVPEDFAFPADCLVLSMYATVPKVARYGLPDYYANPTGFFNVHDLKVSSSYRSTYEDLGDDSGDSATVQVKMSPSAWEALLAHALRDNRPLVAEVAEWVGLNYGRNFDKESPVARHEWTERYLQSLCESASFDVVGPAVAEPASKSLAVIFEFVYPDEDGGTREAQLDLTTGVLTLQAPVPEDIKDTSLVRTRIWTGHEAWEGDDYKASFKVKDQDGGQWRLSRKNLRLLKDMLVD